MWYAGGARRGREVNCATYCISINQASSFRCIWACIWLLSFGVVTNQIVNRVIYYLDDPIMVKVEVNFNKSLKFPAVAICNQNAFRVTAAVKYGYWDLLNAIYSHNSKPLEEILKDRMAEVNAGKIFSDLAHRKEDMIVKCTYNQQTCTPDNFTMGLTDHGVCYFFNDGHGEGLMSDKTGSEAGLQVTINVEQYEYMVGPHDSAGVKMLLFDRGKIPVVKELGQGVATGTHTFIGAEVLEMKRQHSPTGTCARKRKLKYYDTYSDIACRMECLTNYVYGQCHCRAHYMPNIQGFMPQCSLRKYLLCAIKAKEDIFQTELKKCSSCDPECESTIYSPSFSYLTTASHDVDNILRILNENELQKRYIEARDTSQYVEPILFKEDTVLLEDVINRARDVENVLGKNLATILDQQLDQIKNTFEYVRVIYSNMSDIYQFQDYVVRKNFFRGAQAIDERTLTSVSTNFMEYIENFERDLHLLFNFEPTDENEPTRTLLYKTMSNQLQTKASFAEWAQQNITQISEAYKNAKPIFRYWYEGKTYAEHQIIPPNSVLYSAVTADDAQDRLEEIDNDLDGARGAYGKLEAILDGVYENGTLDVDYLRIARRMYMSYITRFNGLRSVVLEDVFRKPVDDVSQKITEFNQLYERVHQSCNNMEQELNMLKEIVDKRVVIWTAMIGIVNKSSAYIKDTGLQMGKTELCKQFTSKKLAQNINQFSDFFEVDLRPRSVKLTDAWNPTYIAIIDFMKDFLADNDTYEYFISNETPNTFFMSIEDLYNEEGFNNYSQSLREEISQKQQEGDLNALFGTTDRNFITSLGEFQKICRDSYLPGNRIDKEFYRNNFLSMDVYFSELNYELIQQQRAYGIIALFSWFLILPAG